MKHYYGFILDTDVKFDHYITSLYRKVAQKQRTLSRIHKYLTHYHQKLLPTSSAVKSQFNYCLLISMICSRTLNNSLNHIHKRALRLVNDYSSSPCCYILNMLNEKTIHQKILKTSPMKFHMHSDIKKTFEFGTESITYVRPQM